MVKHRPQLSAEFVAAPYGGPKAREIARRLFEHGYCIQKGGLQMKGGQLRGALAEALLRRKIRLAAQSLFTASETYQSFAAKVRAAHEAEWGEEDETDLLQRWAAYCVTRQNEEAIEALLKSEPASEHEREQLRKLGARLGECAPAAEAPPADGGMRLRLAEALFLRKLGGK